MVLRPDRAGAQEVRGDVSLQMVDRRERQPARRGDRLRRRDPDQQRADEPGPCVTATRPTSSSDAPARRSASSTAALASSRWWREAISGTTPPYASWIPCDEMTFDSMSPSAVITAAHVSSQLVSMPRIRHHAGAGFGTSSKRPESVIGVRHMMTASSPLSW